MTAISTCRGVSKSYGEGAGRVDALATSTSTVDAGRARRRHGPERLGQEHAADHRRHARGGRRPARCSSTASDVSAMSRNDRAALRRRSIGYVFQDFNLLAGLTAAENVSLPLELDGTRAKAARDRGPRPRSSELGLADRADRFPDELSGGERQRVAIARAVVGDRRLLLADEPTGALDSVNGEAVMRLLRAACKRGVAGVVVTHDAQLASWADRIVFLRDGRVVDQSSPPAGPESLLAPTPGR